MTCYYVMHNSVALYAEMPNVKIRIPTKLALRPFFLFAYAADNTIALTTTISSTRMKPLV
jgi:hypothetical protein